MESLVSIEDETRYHLVLIDFHEFEIDGIITLTIIRNPKVTSSLRTFGHLGFSKDSDTQNHLYHNENLFRGIDIMRVLFDENYF